MGNNVRYLILIANSLKQKQPNFFTSFKINVFVYYKSVAS